MKNELLVPGKHYHIFNRGNNREDLFYEHGNYLYFLNLFNKHINLIANTHAYCLLKNHFHFLVKIKEERELLDKFVTENRNLSLPFSDLFNSYAKSINKAYGRTGSLFQERFKRNEIISNENLKEVILFIHRNPQKHNLINRFEDYPYSSYKTILGKYETNIARNEVLELFGGRKYFLDYHNRKDNIVSPYMKELEDSDFD